MNGDDYLGGPGSNSGCSANDDNDDTREVLYVDFAPGLDGVVISSIPRKNKKSGIKSQHRKELFSKIDRRTSLGTICKITTHFTHF